MPMQMLIDKRGREALLKDVNYFVQRKFAGPGVLSQLPHQFERAQVAALVGDGATGLSRRGQKENSPESTCLDLRQPFAVCLVKRMAQLGNHPQRNPDQAAGRRTFDNPLGPFLNDPMSAEEFEAFQKRVERITDFYVRAVGYRLRGRFSTSCNTRETTADRPGRR